MKLNEDNIELYIFRYKEGLLDAEERAAVEQALLNNPAWQQLADLYDPGLKLPAGATMQYTRWQSLPGVDTSASDCKTEATVKQELTPIHLGQQSKRHGRILPLWIAMAAAACLLLFFTTVIRFINGIGEHSPSTSTLYMAQNTGETIAIDSIEESLPVNSPNVTHPQRLKDEPTLLAMEVSTTPDNPPSNAAPNVMPQPSTESEPFQKPMELTPTPEPDTTPTIEIINKENRKVYYADNVIEWLGDDDADESQNTTNMPSRREKLYSIAKRTTSMIANAKATYDEHKEEIGNAIEERLLSNQFLGSLLAAIDEE